MIKVESDYALCPKFEKAFSILGKKWNGLIIDVLLEELRGKQVENLKKRETCHRLKASPVFEK